MSVLTSWTKCADLDLLTMELQWDGKQSATDPTKTVTFEKVSMVFNYKNRQKVSMRPDLSSKEVLIGYTPSNDWGAQCTNDKVFTNCQVNSTKAFTRTYMGQSVKCYEMNIPNPLYLEEDNYNLDGNYLPACALYDPVDSGKEVFVLGATGVMGMSPSSKYFTNLFGHYSFTNDKFIFNFDYVLNGPFNNRYKFNETSTYSKGTLSLNGYSKTKVDVTTKILEAPIGPNIDFWTLTDVELSAVSSSATTSISKGILCLTNSQNSLMAVKDVTALQSLINQAICQKDTGCPKTSPVSSAPTLTLKIKDFELTLSPEDYLYTTADNQYDQVLDDLSGWVSQSNCPAESSLALGRLFFVKYLAVFTVTKKGQGNTVGFAVKKVPRTLTSGEKRILLGYGLGLSGLVLLVLLVKLISLRGKGEQGTLPAKEEDYVKMVKE